MILILTRHQELSKKLGSFLSEAKVPYQQSDCSDRQSMSLIYSENVKAVVVDDRIDYLPEHAWHDLLGSLGRRIPVFVLGQRNLEGHAHAIASRNSELLHYCHSNDASEVFSMLLTCGAIEADFRNLPGLDIPTYSNQVTLHLLKSTGAISMMTVNANSFRKVAIDYGVEAYQQLQDCFHQIMIEMKGAPGSFRKSDIIMRRSAHSNTYYVFLEQSRQSKAVPAPGVLETMADRIALRLQKELWDEIFKPHAHRKLPDCLTVIPEVSIGYATALYNPSVDSVEIIEHMLESSVEVSRVQVRRLKDRNREVMQTVIQSKDLLYPNFQAVFNLQQMTKEMLDQSKAEKSIGPMMASHYGFESLIRVRQNIADEVLIGDQLVYMDSRLMRPDILFEQARRAKVALELDQVCLGLGVTYARDLPGKLMVNILPRNLLHIERLLHLLKPRSGIIFELSETEGVSNQKLMERIRDFVHTIGCSIAADDFGKGYASIERVIKIRPEIIKLDRSLVENMHKDASKRAFIDGIVRAGKLANSLILAEGVERWEEAIVAKDMGIDLIQGFLCHRPQTLESIQEQIQNSADQKSSDADLKSVA